MLPSIPREFIQFMSLAGIIVGGGFFLNGQLTNGLPFIGFAIWVLLINESMILSKVQNEMRMILDDLNRKRECEIQDLLYFLRESKINAAPLETINGSIKFVNSLPYPAFIMGPSFSIVGANKSMSSLLGWEDGGLDGVAGHVIQDNALMSKVGEICAGPKHDWKQSMSLRYAYLHKDGRNIFGSLHLIKIIKGSFFMVFHPDNSHIVNDVFIKEILKNS